MIDLLSSTTRDVQRVLANSRRIARRQGQTVVTPDYLLLGLLQLSGSQSEAVLKQLQFKLAHLQMRLQALIKLEAGFPRNVTMWPRCDVWRQFSVAKNSRARAVISSLLHASPGCRHDVRHLRPPCSPVPCLRRYRAAARCLTSMQDAGAARVFLRTKYRHVLGTEFRG